MKLSMPSAGCINATEGLEPPDGWTGPIYVVVALEGIATACVSDGRTSFHLKLGR